MQHESTWPAARRKLAKDFVMVERVRRPTLKSSD